jgi:hypothetical protein
MPAKEILGSLAEAFHTANGVGETEVGIERREGHGQGRNSAVDQRLTAALRGLSRSLLTLVLEMNQKLDGVAVLIASHGDSRQGWEDGSISTLQEPLHGVSVGLTVRQALEYVVSGAFAAGKYKRNITANQFVDTEADHGTEGLVDDIDAKAREVDDELSKCAAFEHRLVETHPLVQSDRMRRQAAGRQGSVPMDNLLVGYMRARGGHGVDAPILAGRRNVCHAMNVALPWGKKVARSSQT